MLITCNNNQMINSEKRFSYPTIIDSKLAPPVSEKQAKTAKKRFINNKNTRKESTQPESQLNARQTRPRHLQLIVSKCRCEFYMIDFEDKIGDEDDLLAAAPFTNVIKLLKNILKNTLHVFLDFFKVQNFGF